MFEYFFPIAVIIFCIIILILLIIGGIVSRRKKSQHNKPVSAYKKPDVLYTQPTAKQSVYDEDYSEVYDNDEEQQKAAGREGELIAESIIRSLLCPDDHYYHHLSISFKQQRTELDNIVINRNGVFIVEVKNYSGTLYGEVDDKEWLKIKMVAGVEKEENRKNPINQVKRQERILKSIFQSKGISADPEGYVLLLRNNSPVISDYILNDKWEIDQAIHTNGGTVLDEDTVRSIVHWADETVRAMEDSD